MEPGVHLPGFDGIRVTDHARVDVSGPWAAHDHDDDLLVLHAVRGPGT
ncbi:MAG TPA: hypothetical protein VKG45_16385 [Actinomycetes bacterium]|nr:hypothetical protein [Actinomycetes bacterium]